MYPYPLYHKSTRVTITHVYIHPMLHLSYHFSRPRGKGLGFGLNIKLLHQPLLVHGLEYHDRSRN